MRKFNREVLVVDVESTCWDPPTSKPRHMESEIIEIGVTGVDIDKLEITFNKSILVKPLRSKVSDFCTILTSLTQEDVDDGLPFSSACEKLERDHDSRDKLMVSWGDYDKNMFQRMSKYHRYPFGGRHLNLKTMFAVLHGLKKEVGMDKALEHIGLELEGTHHRGGDDANNIAKILIHTLKKFRLDVQ